MKTLGKFNFNLFWRQNKSRQREFSRQKCDLRDKTENVSRDKWVVTLATVETIRVGIKTENISVLRGPQYFSSQCFNSIGLVCNSKC